MVSVAGVSCKQYEQEMEVFPEVGCPDPQCQGARLHSHGRYRRRLGGELRSLRRGRCPRCEVSHALFPEDLCAYRDATFDAVEAAISAGSPSAGAKATGQDDPQGVRRVRRWLRSLQGAWQGAVQALLPAHEGPWWVRAQAVVGADAGWLTRLRHFLWSRWICLLGGVSGLYRHGRPRLPWPRRSTYLGNCSPERSCANTPDALGVVPGALEGGWQHGRDPERADCVVPPWHHQRVGEPAVGAAGEGEAACGHRGQDLDLAGQQAHPHRPHDSARLDRAVPSPRV